MIHAGFESDWSAYTLRFNFTAITSRASMRVKDTYFMRLRERESGRVAIGECALFKGLSAEDTPDYERRLSEACAGGMAPTSSVRFGIESALASLQAEDNAFLRGEAGIPINGLVWMGDKETMRRRIDEKIDGGFKTVKLKIGGIHFDDELELLRYIRSRYSSEILELRLDANGAFTSGNALEKLKRLSQFDIHSIEQPIKAGQLEAMSRICGESPIPVALDEELIGMHGEDEIKEILDTVKPQYIILKPSLCGGFAAADAWIEAAEARGIGWWATSALESNIGLEAIARWLARKNPQCQFSMPQGLGTGLLYTNNFASPLYLRGDRMFYNPEIRTEIPNLQWHR